MPAIAYINSIAHVSCFQSRVHKSIISMAHLRNAGQDVCKLQQELENPFDSLAITFRCEVDRSWHTIGYIVKEALDDFHEALSAKKTTALLFDWVTPAWYAGIKVSRIGE